MESFGSSLIDRPTLARYYQCVCVRESQVRPPTDTKAIDVRSRAWLSTPCSTIRRLDSLGNRNEPRAALRTPGSDVPSSPWRPTSGLSLLPPDTGHGRDLFHPRRDLAFV